MILGDEAVTADQPQGQISVTIDGIFRSIAQRRPDALALVDAPNRSAFTHGEPRRLTYADAERVIAAIAGRLRVMGLPIDAIVGIQMPNVVENILAILGVMRAGMIAAPLPLLWRRADTIAALARIGGKALISIGRIGAFNQAQFAMRVAAEVFSIRYVCGFGEHLPDGVVPFDDLFSADKLDLTAPPGGERSRDPGRHVGAVNFDIADGVVVPVARSHVELLAGGLAVVLEGALAPDSVILSTLAPSSFAGICLTLLPWLLSGGTLVMHHPFDRDILFRQLRGERCGTLVLPGPVAMRLADSGMVAGQRLERIVALWRSPEQLAASAVWGEHGVILVDIAAFGEAGLVPGRRHADGRPLPLPFGPVVAPRGSASAATVAELLQTAEGTLALRGPMVPHHAFPPGAERSSLPHLKIGRGGLVDSGYKCRVDLNSKTITVTGPPDGLVSVGGYRFALADLQDVIGRIDAGAKLAAVPDPFVGQRLVGNATDGETVKAALNAVGVNPIVVGAFEHRSADSGAEEKSG